MNKPKLFAKDNYPKLILFLYCLLLVYLMFFAFGRLERWDEYHFSLRFNSVPLWIPKHFSLNTMYLWGISLGNLLLFAPFGLLLPLCFPRTCGKYGRGLLCFVLGITFVELLQMLTRLGSFDVQDILVNSMGFSLGYAAWRLSLRAKTKAGQVFCFLAAGFLLTLLCLAGAQIVNHCLFY